MTNELPDLTRMVMVVGDHTPFPRTNVFDIRSTEVELFLQKVRALRVTDPNLRISETTEVLAAHAHKTGVLAIKVRIDVERVDELMALVADKRVLW